MGALDVAKGASMDDDDGMVATHLVATGRAVYEPVFRCCEFCRRPRWPGQA